MATGARYEVNEFGGEIVTQLYDASRKAPAFSKVPKHIAIVMDGNGRWANQKGLTRTEGHKAGELALMEVIAGAIEAGVTHLTAYAFSTENWKRSPDEVRFLMGYNKEVLRRRRDLLDDWDVRVLWAGRKPKLWPSVIAELEEAQRRTSKNKGLTLTMAVNYGGRQELLDGVNQIAKLVEAGKLTAGKISEKHIQAALYQPSLPDVDLFLRTSGEMRTSNFLPWQSTYAEMMFLPDLWPEVTRETLWKAIQDYGNRNRRFGAATDAPLN
jgi:undecaprenyl diphosphate synthase